MTNILDAVLEQSGLPASPFSTFGAFFAMIINVVMGISFSVAVISIAYSGFLYAMSAGDPKNTKTAWNTFLWGVIAVGITLAAFALKRIVAGGIIGADSSDVPAF